MSSSSPEWTSKAKHKKQAPLPPPPESVAVPSSSALPSHAMMHKSSVAKQARSRQEGLPSKQQETALVSAQGDDEVVDPYASDDDVQVTKRPSKVAPVSKKPQAVPDARSRRSDEETERSRGTWASKPAPPQPASVLTRAGPRPAKQSSIFDDDNDDVRETTMTHDVSRRRAPAPAQRSANRAPSPTEDVYPQLNYVNQSQPSQSALHSTLTRNVPLRPLGSSNAYAMNAQSYIPPPNVATTPPYYSSLPQQQPSYYQQPQQQQVQQSYGNPAFTFAPPTIPRPTRYQVLYNQELGSGGYGTVYKAFDTVTGEFLAVKETIVGRSSQEALKGALRTEFETLTKLSHPHIVKVLDFSCDDGKSQIFMEWLPSGSVSHILCNTGFRFHERVIRRYTAEALRGLAYLHSQGILHRDIKPGNMLVTGTGVVKLSDFGTSKTVTQTSVPSTAQIVGTPSYMSKEAIALGKYSTASDVWAMACSVVEMASGRPPWSELPLPQQAPIPLMFRIGNAVPPDHHPAIPPHLSDELKALLARMFDVDADRRPSAEALLADLYFSGDAAKPLPQSAESSEAFEAALRESLQKRQQSTSSVTVSSAWLMTGSSSDFIINRGPSSDGVVPASNQSTRS